MSPIPAFGARFMTKVFKCWKILPIYACEWNLNGGPHRINLIDLDRKDFLEYRKWLLDVEKNSARTAGNKLTRVSQWYRDSLKLKPSEKA